MRKSAAGLLYNLQGISSCAECVQEAVAAIQLIRVRLGDMEDAASAFMPRYLHAGCVRQRLRALRILFQRLFYWRGKLIRYVLR